MNTFLNRGSVQGCIAFISVVASLAVPFVIMQLTVV